MLVAAVLGCAVVSVASAADSPSAQLASIHAAARSERSVHYTQTTTGTSNVRVGFVGDAGLAVGVQHITYSKGGRTGHVTVIATPRAAYVRGDVFTLVNFMVFAPAAAAKYANRWIRIPKTASGYSTVAAGVMLDSVVGELNLSRPLTSVPETTLAGRRVMGVRGNASAAGQPAVMATIYARATGSPLPVEEVATAGNVRYTVVFSGWNEAINVAAPSGATPISVVVKTR